MKTERLQLAAALVVEEFKALKTQILELTKSARSVVSWSLTLYAALFSVGGALLNQYFTVKNQPVILLYLSIIVIGVLAPTMTSLGAWMWLGDLLAIERLAARVRGMERHLATVDGMKLLALGAPLTDETVIAHLRSAGDKNGKSIGKRLISHVVTSAVFFTAGGISVILAVSITVMERPAMNTVVTWILRVASCLVLVVFLAVSFSMRSNLMGIFQHRPPDPYQVFNEAMRNPAFSEEKTG